MQIDFHYYAAYCAAIIAGYTHGQAMEICYSDYLVDECSKTFLKSVDGPQSAASTQLQLEMMDMRTDILGIQDITRIWASFHFLPRDLNADIKVRSKRYRNKYRLICGPNGELVKETVELARNRSLQAAGVAMHVLSDTWAHTNFAGTPSMVINNTDDYFYEYVTEDGVEKETKISFRHSPTSPDDVEKLKYTNSIYQPDEKSIMNLGHGRAGHFPDYSYAKYKYLPAWGDYEEVVKDNPADYYMAFCQMVYALQCLKNGTEFETGIYAFDTVEPHRETIDAILRKRQRRASDDWKAFGESLSGREIPDFDANAYTKEYVSAAPEEKDESFLGRFFVATMAQKSMVTNKVYSSGNLLCGFSVDYAKSGFRGIKDFSKLVEMAKKEVRSNDKNSES